MATDSELLVYKLFHFMRFILSIIIFVSAVLFLLVGCSYNQLRSSKRQWIMFNLCIGMIIFAIINSVFAMLPIAPTYATVLAAQVCALEHFLEDVAQGQVAYALLAFGVHQLGPREWQNRSFLWFGICIGVQWLCSYLLPLPQILLSNVYICFGVYPNQFFTIYSVVFLLVVPIFLHLIIFTLMNILNTDERNNIQVYPAEQIGPTGINDRLLMNCLLIMGLLFALIGYGPRSILTILDSHLKQSIAVYAALEILPSLCLVIDIALLYMMNKEIRGKIRGVCRC